MFAKTPRFPAQGLSPEWIALALAVYFSALLNGPLWQAILATQQSIASGEKTLFIAASLLGVTAFQVGLISLFCWGRLTKPVAALLVLITVSAHYFLVRYGVLFDVSMLRNILETNPQEAGELLTMGFVLHHIKYSAPLLLFLTLINLRSTPFIRSLLTKIFLILGVLIICVGGMAISYKNFSSSMRNHKSVRHMILPASPVISLIRTSFAADTKYPVEKIPLDPQAKALINSSPKPFLLLLVVGESLRAQNWGLSGYARQTTPLLAQRDSNTLFNFPFAKSCGSNTEVSVPCIFSVLGRRNYDETKIHQTESILELLNQVGIKTTWVDNQSGCKGVCTKIDSFRAQDLTGEKNSADNAPDEIFLKTLKTVFKERLGSQVIVMHMLGNHGPAYSQRYPARFEKFTPACKSNDLGNCSRESIVNAYDNVIFYTDYILNELIQQLEAIKTHDVGLVYVADHGESLGEKGIYLHGLPYAIAPEEQTRVPFMIWLPAQTQKNLKLNNSCLQKKVRNPTHHDYLSHTLLGLFQVQSHVINPQLDLLRDCKN